MRKRLEKFLVAVLVVVISINLMPKTDVMAGTNPYPINGINGSSGEYSNCTWTVWKFVYENLGIELPDWGAAGNWYDKARAAGYSVGSMPVVNSIKVTSGHVAFVTGLSADGTQVYVREGGYGTGANLGYHEGYVSAYPSDLRGYIYLQRAYGFDYPVDNQIIDGETFQFSGWIDADKAISSITCSINDGAAYIGALLYTREDVPGATAFRADVNAANLNYGNNKISLCVNYQDGTAETIAYKYVNCARIVRSYGLDSPQNNEEILGESFLFQGWLTASKSVTAITCSVNDGENYTEAILYTREDVPEATAFRVDVPVNKLRIGTNKISICATYSDGTAETVTYRNVTCINNHVHRLFVLNGYDATCDNEGKITYWMCSECSQVFADADGKILVEEMEELIIKATGHTWDNGVITQKSTCVQKGTKTYTCTICNEIKTEEIALDANNHTGDTELRNTKTATCSETGYTGDTYCKDCNTKLSVGTKIEKTNHTAGETVKENITEAICTAAGKYDEVVYCTVCNEELRRETKSSETTGHTWNNGAVTQESTCTRKGTKTYTCTACNETKTEEIEKLEHTYIWIIDSTPTTSQPGSKHEECSMCGDKRNENTIIEKLPVQTMVSDLKSAQIFGIKELKYTGQPLVQQELLVIMDGKVLNTNVDYTVTYADNTNLGTASVIVTGVGNYTGSITKTFRIFVANKDSYIVNNMKYIITNADISGNGTVTLSGTTKKKSDKKFTSLNIGNTVNIGGKVFKITGIADNAFANYTKLKKVKIGNNVSVIGKECFSKCTKIASVSIGSGLEKISDKAFYGCKKLKQLEIKSQKLKNVGKKSVQNVSKMLKIKVPKSKQTAYKKLFSKKTGFVKNTMKLIK